MYFGNLVSQHSQFTFITQVNRVRFPTLFAIAMDYLPIQASSVPCERVFLSSSETDTKKRNRIGPTLMEALQMLKYHLKKTRLDYCAHWTLSHASLVEDDVVEPDDRGVKDKDCDVHDTLEDIIRKSNVEEGVGLADNVIIYSSIITP